MKTEQPRYQGLAEQIALVTGASRGIGAAIADGLADQGVQVVGTATSAAGAAAITARFKERGVSGRGLQLDLAQPASIDAVLTDIGSKEGAATVLVNNAGITRDTLLLRMKPEDWHAVIETNLSGIFRLCKGCLKGMMKARQGRIINITSVVALTGNPGQANYAAAKAGILGFSKSLAREVGSRNITVNCVAPGFIDTDMTRSLADQQRDALLGQIPLGRLGTSDEIAQAVLFLASDSGSYITGETLNINGGMHMA